MLYPIFLTPDYKEKIWGGRTLETKFGKDIPEGRIGESWEVACHDHGTSLIANGPLAGRPLTQAIQAYGKELMGYGLKPEDYEKFPLLIKFLDAEDILSVQVHPSDDYARIHEKGELGKTEAWYVVAAAPGARLVYGVSEDCSREEFGAAAREGRLESYLEWMDVEAGDVIFIPAGMVHAIGAGILICEVQQNSDMVYRVYDWNRLDETGTPRELHIDKALDVIDFDSSHPKEKVSGLSIPGEEHERVIYIVCDYFALERLKIHGSLTEKTDGSRFYTYTALEGEGSIQYEDGELPIRPGDSFLLPACLGQYHITGECTLLKTYVPDKGQILQELEKEGWERKELYKIAGLLD
ncbi:MAG: type I phosphomannose isomerase catalytic subunit [Clostridia bacterium]